MTIVVGDNSYADEVYADSYFASRLYSDIWDVTSADDRDKSLVTATQLLDTLCTWEGYKTDTAQLLEFPRNGETDVPIKIKTAQLEIAFEMLTQSTVAFTDEKAEMSSLKAGSVKLDWYESDSTPITVVNNLAKSYLRQYGSCEFGGSSIQQPKLIR